ncbi:MAG: hypothetical protein A2816_00440 [Candidatus Yanofskybacteria bacterium RIFCSPHIGHO2_01_FULL_39_44]|uniref:Uncharacterized protein n=1 Tax=Candidatus Yanofskybacteria bacterium RIFCSPHIGHO2_02_FULL_43_22 TaxID=1802681 RepID=A0A1F8FN63_9BACT|nr:MAG: hypothetical protein A2816_00440 [Candidatus Yanofskybacteria bacterium RIFCSPHIGHO2_01_FULL_39_44]OGN14574.1 MAG: hypothetical protein A3J47_00345 [Candidatus Yanofskybacteria bacterium RIFCSPHIGHO2_02_FULL_43_22]
MRKLKPIDVGKLASKEPDVNEILLSSTKTDILRTIDLLLSKAGRLKGGVFGVKLAQLTNLLASYRKYTLRTVGKRYRPIKIRPAR